MTLTLTPAQLREEVARIELFLRHGLGPEGRAVVGVSGGVDSDLVARLAVRVVGPARLKLFVALQEGMDPRHLANARTLARELGVRLAEVDLRAAPLLFVRALADADPAERFRVDGLLDPARAKCSVRTVVFSTYHDRGYLVLGTSNRTEIETGFYLPFGDGLSHLAPLAHLYKTQVRQLAAAIGTRAEVLAQPGSAGFWEGQNDLEDLSYWLCNEAPIAEERAFDEEADGVVQTIRTALSTEGLDLALAALDAGDSDETAAGRCGLPPDVVRRLRALRAGAVRQKRPPLALRLEPAP